MTLQRFAFLAALLSIASAPAFGQKEPVRQVSTPKAPTGITKVLTDQAEAWNRGDIEGYMQGYWKSEELIFTSGGQVQRGYDTTLARYKKSYPNQAAMGELTFSDLEVRVLAKGVAWVLGKWKLTRASDSPHGVFTLILKKFPDLGWKIIHDHTSAESSK